MTLIRNFTLGLLLLSCGASAGIAQDRADARASSPPATTVTISTSAKGVRVAALGGVRQMRLEVLGPGGDSLYSSGFQPGSVRDWDLADDLGQRLPDGSYQCLVTFRDLAGRVGTKQGTILLQGGQPSLQLSEAEQSGPIEPEKRLSPVTSDDAPAVTLTAHDGTDGQLVSTRGGLSFRAGDFFTGKDKELMRLTADGNIGIGVAAPKAKLDVAGTIRARGGIQFEDGTVLTSAGGARKGSTGAASAALAGESTTAAAAGSGTTNRLAKWLDGSGTLGDSVITEAGGSVGVGTTSPQATLEVRRDTNGDAGLYLLNAGGGPSSRSIFLMGEAASDARYSYMAYHGAGHPTRPNSTSFTGAGAGGFHFFSFGGLGQTGGLITFSTSPALAQGGNDAVAERVRIDRDGNVGVGTNNPQARLDVAGGLKVSGDAVVAGNIAAKYQDVAEWVPAQRPMAAGTVVVLDVARGDAVRPSRRAYDTHVAGVVSARPGLLLGEAGEGKVMVATTGRVKVRVDATRRPVRVGDMLVTSGREGLAMRSLPVRAGWARLHRPGTIIGKALEPMAGGVGEILVLLSLQ